MKQRICVDECSFIHPNFGSASAINTNQRADEDNNSRFDHIEDST